MHRMASVIVIVAFLASVQLYAQTPGPDPKKLAEDWVDRFNGLSNWHITFDGKEDGLEQAVDHAAELFAANVIAEVPPNDPEQIGPVMLMGSSQVRGWLMKIARSQVNLGYILRRRTQKDVEGELLVFSAPLPWGGTGISFQIIGNYTQREDRKKFMAPGAVFLEYAPDGKINRLRLLEGEVEQVTD